MANRKTVTIQPGGKDLSVVLATAKTKKQNKPASLLHKSTMRKEFPRMAKAVVNQVPFFHVILWLILLFVFLMCFLCNFVCNVGL